MAAILKQVTVIITCRRTQYNYFEKFNKIQRLIYVMFANRQTDKGRNELSTFPRLYIYELNTVYKCCTVYKANGLLTF